jgi:hypothetical protein
VSGIVSERDIVRENERDCVRERKETVIERLCGGEREREE